MTKVDDSLLTDEYNAGSYLTLSEFLNYYGVTDASTQALNGAILTKYKDWVNNANRTVETAVYPFNDSIPIDKGSESFTYAKSMALHWAQYEKAADEGSPNAKTKKELWTMDKEMLINTMKAQPQQTTTRTVVSSDFKTDEIRPYSQTYGVSDLL